MRLTEIFFIGDNTYTLRFRNGIHQVVLNGEEVVFEGWYEKCRAFLKDKENWYLESLY